MPDIEIKRGYEALPDNNVRFGIRVINNSDFAISDVEVILDYNESLFEIEGSKIQKLGNIPPTVPRTVKFILKPFGCIHKEEVGATVIYKDHQWKKHTEEMRPKEVHCVCSFMKEKSITRDDYLKLSNSGYLEERGINFEGIDVDKLVEFLAHTCRNRLYKVDEIPIESGKILYLAGDALGEKAYYLLTTVVREYEGLTQVLLRASSDKSHGLNGFLNEILDNLRHLMASTSVREIGIIKKEQVINIIDSYVNWTTFSGGEGTASINIKNSFVNHADIKEDEERKRREEKQEEERLKRQQEELERIAREKEELRARKEEEGSSKRNRRMVVGIIAIIAVIIIGAGLLSGRDFVGDNSPKISAPISTETPTAASTETAVAVPTETLTPTAMPVITGTQVAEITPTGNKTYITLDRYRIFRGASLNLRIGDEVIWSNEGLDPITVTSDDIPGFAEKFLDDGRETLPYMFKSSGTYTYYLKNNKNVNGTIKVT